MYINFICKQVYLRLNQKLINNNSVINNNQIKENQNRRSRSQMRKQVILIMEGNQYPFGQAEQSMSNKTTLQVRTLVRKKHDTRSLQQRNQLLDKIHIAKNIQSSNMMKIQTVLQQQNSVHVLYEYVPMGFIKTFKNLTQIQINKIKQQIFDLGASLAEVGILVQWDSKNIGISNKLQAKYYLDLQKIKVEKKSGGAATIQKLNFQNIIAMFSAYSNSMANKTPKQSIQRTPKQSIKQSVPKLSLTNLQPKKRLEDELDNLFNPRKESNQQIDRLRVDRKGKLSTNRSKRSDDSQTKQKKAMRKSKTDWKQLDNNAQFMQDFLNVLDDKSQNAESKYISDQELEQHPQSQTQDKNINQKQLKQSPQVLQHHYIQQQDQEQIIWRSTLQKQRVDVNDNSNQLKKSQDQEVIWMDYRDFSDIKQRAQAAIKRSTHILSVFKKLINSK